MKTVIVEIVQTDDGGFHVSVRGSRNNLLKVIPRTHSECKVAESLDALIKKVGDSLRNELGGTT